MEYKYIAIAVLISLNFTSITGLQCYRCSATENEADKTCMDSPESMAGGIITCSKRFCTSVRIEYLDPKDKVASISRTCEDEPVFINQIIEDSTFRSYFIACQSDLCNGGSGKDTSQGTGAQGDTGGYGTLLVPGKKGGASNLTSSFGLLTVVSIALAYFYVNQS